MKAILTTEPITAEQIQAWKAKYKDVFAIDVEGDTPEETVTGYFRKPSINELTTAQEAAGNSFIKLGLAIVNTCLLGGHPSFGDNDEVKRACIEQFKDIIKIRKANLKKL